MRVKMPRLTLVMLPASSAWPPAMLVAATGMRESPTQVMNDPVTSGGNIHRMRANMGAMRNMNRPQARTEP